MGSAQRIGPRACGTWGLAPLAGLFALALLLRDRHAGLYGDGPALLDLWRQGGWFYLHLLFLPVARSCHALLSLAVEIRPHEAIQAVSIVSAVLLVVLTVLLASRFCRIPAFALASGGLVLCTGALRFHAGAVEIHALAGAAAALAALLVLVPARGRGPGLLAFCLAFLLGVAGHLSLILLGPALLLLHLEAEARAGRPVTLRTAIGHGAAAAGCLVALGLLFLLLDRLAMGWDQAWQTGFRGYAEFLFLHYSRSGLQMPWTVTLMAEAVAPYGALLVAAAAGIVPAWRRSPLLATGLAAWVGALGFAALRVGAREYGAYLVPALPALGRLAALGLDGLACSRKVWGVALGAAALLLLQTALLAWAAGHGLERGSALVYPHPWIVTGAELGLPAWTFLEPLARCLPWPAWLAASLVAALPVAWTGREERALRPLAGCCAVALFALCMFVLQANTGPFRRCWPRIWDQHWADYCDRAAHRIGDKDVLVSCAPSYSTHFQVNYALNQDWVNLWLLDEPDGAIGAGALEEARRLCRRARAAGGSVVLSADGLTLFRLAEKGCGRPRQNGHALLSELGATARLWPFTEPDLRRVARALD